MGKQHIFFDLDGTLTDSMPGITRAVQYALRRYGIQVDDLNVLKPFVGPPRRKALRSFMIFRIMTPMRRFLYSGNIIT